MTAVIMMSNVATLPDLVRLMAEKKVRYMNFMHLAVLGGMGMEKESCLNEPRLCNDMTEESQRLAEELGVRIVKPIPIPEQNAAVSDQDVSLSDEGGGNALLPDAGSSLSLDEYLDRQNREFLLKVRPKKHHNRPCYFPWYYIHVNPDGTVFPCGSWWEHTSFGDFKTQTFVEIWTGAKFKGLRKQLYHTERRQTCANCDVSNMGRPDVKASFAQRGAGPPAGAAGGGPPRLRLGHSTPRHALSASFHLQSRRSRGARPRCRLGTGGRTDPAAALGT